MLRMVVNFCEKLQADLVVFHAYKIALVDEYMPSAMVDSMLDEGEKAALEKLHELTSGLETSVQIDYQVKMGFTAESISEAANTSGADLIMMGTNGCNSLEDRMFRYRFLEHYQSMLKFCSDHTGRAAVPAFQNIIFPIQCTDKDLEIATIRSRDRFPVR